ncbi:hypothetical protein E2C01_016059 [Portunus trituberculatus]|uniref:Uncharacterized protein n=1 Tax=Portunus trituberculatus TaxID=210409 RepID=A0A5B7DPR3_PORTR|nr:hypothetical protein [Portunus trituberculatus]
MAGVWPCPLQLLPGAGPREPPLCQDTITLRRGRESTDGGGGGFHSHPPPSLSGRWGAESVYPGLMGVPGGARWDGGVQGAPNP